MIETQPEALALADALLDGMSDEHWNQLSADAAAMLRTQHAALERKDALLRQALETLTLHQGAHPAAYRQAVDAIKQELSQ